MKLSLLGNHYIYGPGSGSYPPPPDSNPLYSYSGNDNTDGTEPSGDTVAFGDFIVLSDNTGNLVKDGFVFVGWNTQPDGNGTHYDIGDSVQITTSRTFYAEWTANVTLTYVGNGNTGGTAPSEIELASGESVVVSDNTGSLSKTDYVFTGWNTQSNGSGTHYDVGDNLQVNASMNLYAEWGVYVYEYETPGPLDPLPVFEYEPTDYTALELVPTYEYEPTDYATLGQIPTYEYEPNDYNGI